MDGNSNRDAGLESANSGGNADHPAGVRSSAVSNAQASIKDALRVLEYSTKQEVEAARVILNEALEQLEEAGAPGQG